MPFYTLPTNKEEQFTRAFICEVLREVNVFGDRDRARRRLSMQEVNTRKRLDSPFSDKNDKADIYRALQLLQDAKRLV
jgi:hypothetical protein